MATASPGLLQDVPAYDPGTIVDPATGVAYPTSDPRYVNAIMQYLAPGLIANIRRSDAARGMDNSGVDLADQAQALSNLEAQIAQGSMSAAEQERQTRESQQFQSGQMQEQLQANAALQEAQARAGSKQAMLQGAGQLAGIPATMMMGKYLFGGGPTPGTTTQTGLKALPWYQQSIFGGGGSAAGNGISPVLTYSDGTPLTGVGISQTPEDAQILANAGITSNAAGGATGAAGGATGAAGSAGGTAATAMPAAWSTPEGLGLGGLGGLMGYQIGGGPKDTTAAMLGGGLGGLLGYAGGAALAPATGGLSLLLPMLGAGAGSGFGRQIGNFFSHLF